MKVVIEYPSSERLSVVWLSAYPLNCEVDLVWLCALPLSVEVVFIERGVVYSQIVFAQNPQWRFPVWEVLYGRCNAPVPRVRGRHCDVHTQVRSTLTYIR